MKYDPVNELYYDATLEEFAKFKGGHSGLSLPGSVAARLRDREQQHRTPRQRAIAQKIVR
jgi:hypothetical protein